MTGSAGKPTCLAPILAGLAVVILLGRVYPWGSVIILRPLLRTSPGLGRWWALSAWPGSS